MESMEDILADKPVEKPVEQPVERPESTRREHQKREWEAQGRDPESGQFKAKEPPKEEPKPETKAKEEPKPEVKEAPKQDFSEKERAFLRTAEEERRKRQALEKEVAELRAKANPPAPEKPFWEAPEEAVKGIKEQVQKEIAALRGETGRMFTNFRLQTSEAAARGRYKDFDEHVAEFGKMVESNPAIAQQWLASPDPAEFAYKAGKQNKEIQSAGSLEALRENIRKEERLKLEAELKEKEKELRAQREALPGSLSNAKGTTVNKPVWGGPTSMDDILGS